MREARDEAIPNRISGITHDNWNCAGCLLHGTYSCRCTQHDNVDIQSHHLGGKVGKSFVKSLGKAPLDGKILAFDVSEIAHPLRESGENVARGSVRCTA